MNSFIAAWITLAIGTIAICFCFFIMRKKALRWTQIPPTECGWWWVRNKGSIEIAEIALSGNVQNAGDFLVALCNDNFAICGS